MIPNNNDNNNNLKQDFEVEEQPTKTYYIDLERKSIVGYCDGIEAVKQAIYKILNTERFDYLIYSWNYGIELKGLTGEPITYVIPELQRVIKEALIQDDRILDVEEFTMNKEGSTLKVTFNVKTKIGDIEIEKVVNIQ